MESILTSVKKAIGLDENYTQFDTDIIMYINGVFMGLTQIGIGPVEGFSITDKNQVWSDFIGDRKDLEAVKTCTALKVRLLFDPPQNGFLVDAINKQITEYEWRLNVQAEGGTTNA